MVFLVTFNKIERTEITEKNVTEPFAGLLEMMGVQRTGFEYYPEIFEASPYRSRE